MPKAVQVISGEVGAPDKLGLLPDPTGVPRPCSPDPQPLEKARLPWGSQHKFSTGRDVGRLIWV